jgi:opacity protein-like surface antigen
MTPGPGFTHTMKNILAAAVLTVVLAGVSVAAVAQSYCTTRCSPTYGGGYNCTQSCF